MSARNNGQVAAVTVFEQVRDRTAELIDTPNVGNEHAGPHYSTAVIALDSSLGVGEGDLWKITLNGEDFTYVVDSNDNLTGVAEELKDEINDFTRCL